MKPFKLLVLLFSFFASMMTLILSPKLCETKFPELYVKLEIKGVVYV